MTDVTDWTDSDFILWAAVLLWLLSWCLLILAKRCENRTHELIRSRVPVEELERCWMALDRHGHHRDCVRYRLRISALSSYALCDCQIQGEINPTVIRARNAVGISDNVPWRADA